MKRRNFLKSVIGVAAGLFAAPFLPSFKMPVPAKTRRHALPARIDELSLNHWYRAQGGEIELYDVAGQTIFPCSGPSGGLSGLSASYLYRGELPNNFETLPLNSKKPFQVAKFEEGAYAIVNWDANTPPEAVLDAFNDAAEALTKV